MEQTKARAFSYVYICMKLINTHLNIILTRMRKQFFWVLGLLMAFAVQVCAEVVYTLPAVKNSTNASYAGAYDLTINGMLWSTPGNQSFDGWWRIGGSSITNQERTITGKSPMSGAAKSVVINHNGVSKTAVSVPLVKLTVASDAAFTNIIDEVTVDPLVDNSSTGIAGSFALNVSENVGEWPSGSYYKITFYVTHKNSSNAGLDFTSAMWSTEEGAWQPSHPLSALTQVPLQPLTPAANVMSIYSDVYPSEAPNADYNHNWYGAPTMMEEAIYAGQSRDGDRLLHYTGMTTGGFLHWELGTVLNLSGMQYLHLDVYPVSVSSLQIILLSDGNEVCRTASAIALTAGEWNGIDLNLSSQFTAGVLSSVNQIQFVGQGEMYLDNVYFSSVQPTTEVEILPDSVVLNVTELTLIKTESFQFIATVYPENARNKELTWSASANSSLTIDGNGLLTTTTSSKTGTITVTTVNGKTATCQVTMLSQIDSLSVRVHPNNITSGASLYLYATFGARSGLVEPLGASPGTVMTIDEEGWYKLRVENITTPPLSLTFKYMNGTSTKTSSTLKTLHDKCYYMTEESNKIVMTEMEHVPSHTVRFENWNGAKLQESRYPEGAVPTLNRPNPTRAGDSDHATYTFTGWIPDIDTVRGADITYVAKFGWPCAVTFLDYDSTVIEVQSVPSGTAATAPADPIYETGMFIGWDTDFSNVAGDMTVRAIRDPYMRDVVINRNQTETGGVTYLPKDNTILIAADKYIKRISIKTTAAPDISCDTGSLTYDAVAKELIWTGCAHIVHFTYTGTFTYTTVTARVTSMNCAGEPEILEPAGQEGPITVRLAPQSCSSWTTVRLWAWTAAGSIFSAWPGQIIELGTDGWYSYTFDESINLVNIIWTDGSNQTSDITDVVRNTCYALNSQSGTSISVREVDNCPSDAPEPDPENRFVLVKFMDYDDITPLDIQILHEGASAVTPQTPTREGYTFDYWDRDYTNVQKDLRIHAVYTINQLPDTLEYPLPALNGFYDFTGHGKKGAVVPQYLGNASNSSRTFHLAATADYSTNFQPLQAITQQWKYSGITYNGMQPHVVAIEDLNNDGEMDFGGYAGAGTPIILRSSKSEYNQENNDVMFCYMDINRDGRQDYIRYESGQRYICYRQPDGTYTEELMQGMTRDEFEDSFDLNAWMSYTSNASSLYTTINYHNYNAGPLMIGADLARAPRRAPASVEPGVPYEPLPTICMDMDGDGWPDLIDENNGIIWYQRGQGKWVVDQGNMPITIRDLNGDGIPDIVFVSASQAIYMVLSQGNTFVGYKMTELPVDREVYIRDFNKDGYPDVAAAMSSSNHPSGYAYTVLFLNNGNGTFTAQTEQNYGTTRLLFKACQDVDGDGYYDMLACQLDANKKTTGLIYWLRGQSDCTFAAPQLLYNTAITTSDGIKTHRLNVADLDGDNKQEVWASRLNSGVYPSTQRTVIKFNSAGIANTAPTAPAQPQVAYNRGVLTVSWGNGSDAESSNADLTYALRIGTTPGGNDILNPHALADGTRRNFAEGNMLFLHEYKLDLSSYAPSMIYVAVQTIDAQYAGSEWSPEASVLHDNISANFSLDKTEISFDGQVIAFFPELPGYTHEWIIEDGEAASSSATGVIISFTATGNKSVTHIVLHDGVEVARMEQHVNVLPNGKSGSVSVEYGFSTAKIADYTLDGNYDAVYGNLLKTGDENYLFTNAVGTWNMGITTSTSYNEHQAVWIDHTLNGAIDYIYRSTDNRAYALIHNGTDGIAEKREDNMFGYYTESKTFEEEEIANPHIDFTHDGRFDFLRHLTEAEQDWLVVRRADGSYGNAPLNTTVDAELMRKLFYNQGKENVFRADINHDGFIDMATIENPDFTNSQTLVQLTVMLNKGEGTIEQMNIPFARTIAREDCKQSRLVDINADGYLDLFGLWSDGAPYIMWNNNNRSFRTPYFLPEGNLEGLLGGGISPWVEDINNDGYQDVIATQYTSLTLNTTGIYVWYMGATGVVQQGFAMPDVSSSYHKCFRRADHMDLYDMDQKMIHHISGPSNEQPAAPTNVRAQQTADGLLIEWDAAVDDHTPANLLRYNLSVKKAGKTGEEAYLISPQNGGNAQAAPLPNDVYDYISATRFFIPTSSLEARSYEISLQAIDLWDATSAFSAPITVAVTRSPLNMPSLACANKEVIISYAAEPEATTPVWNFDGGQIVSGSGYGPYSVKWTTPGTKVVSLTVNGVAYSDTIEVDQIDFVPPIPTILFKNQTVYFNFPDELKPVWYAVVDGIEYCINGGAYSQISGRPLGISAGDGYRLALNNYLYEGSTILLRLVLYTADGCEVSFEQYVRIATGSAPTISLVTVDANAHNVINFDADVATFPQVRILKETNVLNEFAEVDVVSTSGGSYTDMSSNAAQQPDRYKVQGIMANGNTTGSSAAHKTVHATINKGIVTGVYNLIWNAYEGAEVVTYNILRGSSKTALTQIASVAASASSYTDNAPDDAQPYYAVEYVLAAQASAPAYAAAPAAALSGRSNVVHRSGEENPPVQETYYTIRFLNWDGALLQSGQVKEGDMPAYTGATPTRPEDESYTYTFSGWNPTIVAATVNADYTAQYTATEKKKEEGLDEVVAGSAPRKILFNGVIYILRDNKLFNLQGALVK